MSKSRVFLCLVSICVVLSSLGFAATQDRIRGALTGATVQLRGNVHHLAQPQFDQGAVDPAMPLGTITLLTLPTAAQQTALTQLLAQQQDRNSPNFHKWLTPEQYADRFGLSQHDIQQIVAWLKSQGFTMVNPARGRNWVSFTGTAAQVQSAFGTEVHRFNVNGEMHYANATAPKIPGALAGVATGFRGLDDFRPKPRAIRRARPYYYSSTYGDFVAPGDVATIYDINNLYSSGIDGTGQTLAVMGQTDIYLADLVDFRTGFGLSSISCTTNSSGVITACNDPHFKYVLDGTDPGLSTSGDISEADLDLEWSGAVARNAQIIYVNSTDTFTSYYYAVDNKTAPVISLSYGFCEFYDNLLAQDEAELQKANSEGITFVNSSGDTGVAECDYSKTITSTNLATMGLAVSYPASSPEVTGTGGTATLLADWGNPTYWGTTNSTDGGSALSYVPEQVWNDDLEIYQYCQQNAGSQFCTQGGSTAQPGWVPITSEATAQTDIGISSTGGGASNCAVQNSTFTQCVSGFPKPSWQTVTVLNAPSVRLSPDVSFMASPNFPGYIFCTPLSELGKTGTTSSCAGGISSAVDTYLSIIGGTSASAPIFAGVVALLNQYLSSSGLGNVNPTLYQLAATPANGAFHQVTSGDNNVYCQPGTPSAQPTALQCPSTGPSAGVIGYLASNSDTTTGYNLVAGLGSVDVDKLAVAWAGTITTFTMSATALNPATVSAGSSTTTTVTVTPQNGFTGDVSLSCSGITGVSCSGTVTGGSGTAQVTIQTTPNTPVGTGTVTIKGTSGAVSATTTVSLTVTATTETFSVTASIAGGTLTVAQGQTTGPVNMTVESTSTPSFIVSSGSSTQTALAVTYSCTGLPSEAVCTFSPAATTQSTSVTLTITTAAPVGRLQRPMDRGGRIFYAVLLPGLLGIFLTFGSRKRSLGGMRMLGLILVLGCATLWTASCGGSSSSSTPKDPGTPTGTSTVTVNATTSGSSPITANPTVTFKLTVTP